MRCPRFLLPLVWLLAITPPAFAAGPKAIGTMSLAGHPDLAAVQVVAVEWTARNSTQVIGGGGGVGKVSFDDFKVVKLLDATSPALLQLTFDATAITKVTVDLTLKRGTTVRYELVEARILANARRSSASGLPVVQELSFAAPEIRETVTSPGGVVTSCYNVQTIGACN